MNKTPICLLYTTTKIKAYDIDCSIIYLNDDKDIIQHLNEYHPDIIISIADTWNNLKYLMDLPYSIRHKWIHYESPPDIELLSQNIYHCFLNDILNPPINVEPLISIFTTTFNSGEKIKRPYNSLIDQTYHNWEWIIVDDSLDNGETFQQLKILKKNDMRIKIYKRDKHSGKIGEVKNEASNLCRGKYLVELDHDDELTPSCLYELVDHFLKYPKVGFIYTDFSEIFFPSLDNFKYSENWAMGFGSYRKCSYHNKWINVANSVPINQHTILNIVGVPNHVRSWRTSVFKEIGGYNINLSVADDYELLIRTFLKTEMMRIPILGYIQYKNPNQDNFSIIRNSEITKLQHLIMNYYYPDIKKRLEELNLIVEDSNNSLVNWERPFDNIIPTFNIKPLNKETITIILPTYNREKTLIRAINSVLQQTYLDWKLYIIGDNCPILEDLMEFKDIENDYRIEWWNLEKNYNDGGTTPRNYALRMLLNTQWVTYLDDDNYWDIEHLDIFMNHIQSKPGVSYGFSSFVINDETHILSTKPLLYRIDTSAIIHKNSLLQKYGYWKTRKEAGYSHDWELVSRWDKEEYFATQKYTLYYYNDDSNKCHPELIYNYYDDQHNTTTITL